MQTLDNHAAWKIHAGSLDSGDLLAAGSLPRAWAELWADDPARKLLITPGGDWQTAEQLDQRSRAAAYALWQRGVRPGDRVIFSAASSLALIAAHIGALRLGAIVIPMNTSYTAPEVAHIVTDAGPRLAVMDDDARAQWIRDADSATDTCRPEELSAEPGADAPALDQLGADDDALICYTSGTTGRPKGAVLTHGNLLASARALLAAWRWTAQDRLLLALPLFHIHGLGVGLHGSLLAGASVVLVPKFDVDTVIDAINAYHCTLFFGVPTMYTRLVASPRAADLARLRLCVSGSAPLPPALFEQIKDITGSHVLERYGMTETLMLISNPYDQERRAGTVGLPLPGVEVRLRDGDSGELLVRGPNVFRGYWRNPEASAGAFEDGWFKTGDIGELDADGYVSLVGRAKELIITGGFNVYPREVEEVIAEHPGIREAAVAGLPSAEWGETVAAFVVRGDEALTEDDLAALAAERLAPYKRPRVYRFVDSLPRNSMGKIVRGQLPRS